MSAGVSDEHVSIDEFALVRAHAEELGVPIDRVDELQRMSMEADGRAVSALKWGRGSPSIAFLHGGAQNAHTWDKMLLRWPVDAVAVDLPGHGRSAWIPGSAYLPRELAPIVATSLRQWAPDVDALVGMSLGGLVALRMASTGDM